MKIFGRARDMSYINILLFLSFDTSNLPCDKTSIAQSWTSSCEIYPLVIVVFSKSYINMVPNLKPMNSKPSL